MFNVNRTKILTWELQNKTMPNYCTVTFSSFSEHAVRLRPLKQKAATSKVTPCLRSTNNIIVLNASCLIAVSITFLSELL